MCVLSLQATTNTPYSGGAIYNDGGTVRLLGGVEFTGNFVVPSDDGLKTGDGGAVWNGPGARMATRAAYLEGNGVGAGGRGGGLWNEGFVEFRGAAGFRFNEVSV